MKTQEEKAKAYDEALEKAKKLYEKGTITESLNYVFPELAESEDEKIRKWLIGYFNQYIIDGMPQVFGNGLNVKDVIAWLEKQQSVEEIVERYKKSWYNEGKIDGKFEGIADDVKYQQGWHDAIEKQGEQNSAWINGYSNGYIQAVEKAVEWLENHNDYIDVKDGNVTYFDMEKCVEDFRKAMKGGEE